MSAAMGVDVGGTFTDEVLVDDAGSIHVAKVVTTPSDPRDGVRHGVEVALAEAGLEGRDITRFVHGTTLATNVLLERQGARTALAVASRHSGSSGFGMPFGKWPSGSCWMRTNSKGRCGASWSTTAPAPPLPALTTMRSGASRAVST